MRIKVTEILLFTDSNLITSQIQTFIKAPLFVSGCLATHEAQQDKFWIHSAIVFGRIDCEGGWVGLFSEIFLLLVVCLTTLLLHRNYCYLLQALFIHLLVYNH